KTKMSLALSGENHPLFGETHTADTKALMSLAKKGIAKSEETRAKMSVAQGTAIYVYSSDGTTFINSFPSARNAAKFFNSCHSTMKRYALNGKFFQAKWILSTSFITQIGDCES